MPEILSRKEARAQGLKRYFTGKPCGRGHVSERWVIEWGCIECARLRERGRYQRLCEGSQEFRDRRRTYNRQYNAKIRDLIATLRKEMPELLKEFGL